MTKFIFALLALSMTACSTMSDYGRAFKSSETLRQEHFAQEAERRAQLSPDELKAEDKLNATQGQCSHQANAYGSVSPQAVQTVYKSCMAQNGY